MSTLFIVDDDMIFQRIIKMTLIKYPVFKQVHYFNDGEPLISYLKENRNDYVNLPDAIFLDLVMFGLDGWGVLDAIQELYHSLCKKTNVYIVTASIMQIDKEKASKYEFVKEFISKPLYQTKIMSINKALTEEYQYLN
jgi:CheY-like chemotaxis protein